MRVILHIGQHKTGSKALQSALYANRGFLARHGYRYSVPPKARRLRPYEMNHHGLFVVLRQAMASASPGGQRLTAVKRYLQKLITVKNTDHHTVIFSCEDLFDMHTAHESELKIERISEAITILAEVFNALKVELNIVCYLRRQDHLLGAHYAQFIKGSSTHWLSINDYARLAAPRLCYDRILGLWETGFGIDAIRALAYERQRMPAGIVGAFFEDVLRRLWKTQPIRATIPL